MAPTLSTFAKARALHDSTANPGEKAAAAARMKALAGKAGLTVRQAEAQLDAPRSATAAETIAQAFHDIFNTPELRAQRAERDRERADRRTAALAEYGSEDAVFADTPMEAALRQACAPLLGQGETWNELYRLAGWYWLDGRKNMPVRLREAVAAAWPMPSTVAEVWAEHAATEKLGRDRAAFFPDYNPHGFVEVRQSLLEDLLDTLPAKSLNDVRARLSWLEYWPGIEVDQSRQSLTASLAALRADIERMGQRIRDEGRRPC
ncbi:hypothetical protein [Methylobacterium sp. A54F]